MLMRRSQSDTAMAATPKSAKMSRIAKGMAEAAVMTEGTIPSAATGYPADRRLYERMGRYSRCDRALHLGRRADSEISGFQVARSPPRLPTTASRARATDPISDSPMVGRFPPPAAADSPRVMPETRCVSDPKSETSIRFNRLGATRPNRFRTARRNGAPRPTDQWALFAASRRRKRGKQRRRSIYGVTPPGRGRLP